ncbi:hypothetical protein GGH19_002803 [Coemansia sp. RSA 1807]|nr:hypothetical protein EV176_002258 [Coemansia sp. RSA 451]KAJ2575681.1 hypothetical protein GGH19_002803 [Coemansia sp. RSA 1807]
MTQADALKDVLPRLVVYYQTHHDKSDKPISILPLLQPGISVSHVILAAIHINEDPNAITLNDHAPDHQRNSTLWSELSTLQACEVKVMGMLGGAAKGSYARLDGSDKQFEQYYVPLRDFVRQRNFDGLDLCVEEKMSLSGILRLIDRLKSDFGQDFIISLAPVAAAMLDPAKNLSGFSYMDLESARGSDIAWYNMQFYCGWGDISNTYMYDFMVQMGWNPEKLVVGMVTNPETGSGFVPWEALSPVLFSLTRKHRRFGGVMCWEYFNSLPGDVHQPWEWARNMTLHIRSADLI